MIRAAKLMALAIAICAPSLAAAQLNLPPQLTYHIPDRTPSQPPEAVAASAALPQVPETVNTAGLMETSGAIYIPRTGSNQEVKGRFVCVESGLIARRDQVRLPKLDPAGHLHKFFGLVMAGANVISYPDIRAVANSEANAGRVASSCPGDSINTSMYWLNAYTKKNALGDGVERAKRYDNVVLYYVGNTDTVKGMWPLMPGQKFVFGRNMDDPNMTRMQALVDAYAAAHPEMALAFDGTRVGGSWKCNDRPDLGTFASLEDPAFDCPVSSRISQTTNSFDCWSGKLSTPDGYSVSIPSVHSNADGGQHCPEEFPYRQLRIDTTVNYSHQGRADYSVWRSEADDHMATVLGRPVKNGEAVHQDYIFGWQKKFSDIWQCSVGVPVPGKDCSVPHELDYSTIGPDESGAVQRLISNSAVPNSGGKPLAPDNLRFYGSKLTDWTTLPAISKQQHQHGPVTIEVR